MACGGALGRKAKLYLLSTETDTTDAAFDTPAEIDTILDNAAWKEVCAVDVQFNAQKEKIDTSDRCSGSYKAYVPGQQEGTISFKAYKRKPIAAGDWLDILRVAFASDSTITALMLDDARTVDGADGVIANVNVFNMSENQPLNGPIEIDFELAISGCTTYSPPARTVTRPTA